MDVSTIGGAGEVDTQTTSTVDNAGQTSAGAPAEPSVIDLDENALIRIKGQEKPVKFGEYSRGFQSQFTRASQKAAQLQRELEQERQARQRYEQERQRAAQQGGQAQPDVYAKLRELPYLTGEEAVGVVQSIGREIQQRDYIMAAALKELQGLKKLVSGLHESSSDAQFESKIGKFLADAGYDAQHEGLRDLAKEIYLAYEGDDLDYEFPRIFGERMTQIEKFFEARRQAASSKARSNPFVPGRGGVATPSKPLQMNPAASPKEVVDQLWEQLQAAGT